MSTTPTAADLIVRLREIHEAQVGKPLSDENLAARLPITLSTLNRWKRDNTRQFQQIVEMLYEAGWLSMNGDAPSAEASGADPLLEEVRADVAELLLTQAEILEKIGAPRRERSAQTQAAPKRKAAGRKTGP